MTNPMVVDVKVSPELWPIYLDRLDPFTNAHVWESTPCWLGRTAEILREEGE